MEKLRLIGGLFAIMSAAINPAIYAARIRRFRLAIKKLLRLTITQAEKFETYEIRRTFRVRRSSLSAMLLLSDEGSSINTFDLTTEESQIQPSSDSWRRPTRCRNMGLRRFISHAGGELDEEQIATGRQFNRSGQSQALHSPKKTIYYPRGKNDYLSFTVTRVIKTREDNSEDVTPPQDENEESSESTPAHTSAVKNDADIIAHAAGEEGRKRAARTRGLKRYTRQVAKQLPPTPQEPVRGEGSNQEHKTNESEKLTEVLKFFDSISGADSNKVSFESQNSYVQPISSCDEIRVQVDLNPRLRSAMLPPKLHPTRSVMVRNRRSHDKKPRAVSHIV